MLISCGFSSFLDEMLIDEGKEIGVGRFFNLYMRQSGR